MRMNRRQRAIGKRLVALYMGPHTEEAMAEVVRLRSELDAARPVPPPPVAELPPAPGEGTFTMRRTERAAPPEETEADRWRKVLAMRDGTGGAGRIWHPERAR